MGAPVNDSAGSRFPAKDLALIAVFAALIAALGAVPSILVPGNPVPITLQTLGVMLAGAILGARRGALAVLTFLALVAMGLPLLSGGRGGFGVFLGPSAGYLIGFVFGAYVIGLLLQARAHRWSWWWGGLSILIGGVVVVYLFGIPVQSARMGTTTVWQVAAMTAAYLPGDLVKVVVATVLAGGVYRGYPSVTPAGRVEQPVDVDHVR